MLSWKIGVLSLTCHALCAAGLELKTGFEKGHRQVPAGTTMVHLDTVSVAAEMVPQVRHRKSPGVGYAKNSPLYAKQQAYEKLYGEFDFLPPMPPVSVALRCITTLVALWFAVYILLFLVQTLTKRKILQTERQMRTLHCATETLLLVPMICILFLITRMRAVQITAGFPELYHLPQWWVKSAMIWCTGSMVAQTLLSMIAAAAYGQQWENVGKSPPKTTGENILRLCRIIVLKGIYVGFAVVCVGLCTMPVPTEIWGEQGVKLSSAAVCTMILSVLYLSVYFAQFIARIVNEAGILGNPTRFSPMQDMFKDATNSCAFAPMLCILFVNARLRALQLDPENGQPKFWAQTCFYVCTECIYALVITVFLKHWFGLTQREGEQNTFTDEELAYRARNTRWLELVRHVIVACLYISAFAVAMSIFFLEAPQGKITPAMPTSMRCTAFLAVIYIFCYLILRLVNTWQAGIASRMGPNAANSLRFQRNERFKTYWLKCVKYPADFCPMICILFLSTFLRALQITQGQGAPPGWCQDFMTLCCASIVLQILVRFDQLMEELPSKLVTILCDVVHHLSLAVMYFSIMGVIVGLFGMTRETAHGVGSMGSAL